LIAGILLGARLSGVFANEAARPGADLQVLDGDTVEIASQIVHLFGIEAPELGQRCLHDGVLTHCGLDAAFELKKLVGVSQSPLKCLPAASRDSIRLIRGPRSPSLQRREVVQLRLGPLVTSNVFLAGHRIRLEVSSSNFPRFARNLNTGGDNARATEAVVARNAVHHGGDFPSRIVLKIVPR